MFAHVERLECLRHDIGKEAVSPTFYDISDENIPKNQRHFATMGPSGPGKSNYYR